MRIGVICSTELLTKILCVLCTATNINFNFDSVLMSHGLYCSMM